jgi:HEAT repeat protein
MSGLLVAVLALVAVNLAFALLVVALRVHNVRRAATLEQRRLLWYPRIIGLISDGTPPEDLTSQVGSQERSDVVEIAWDISRRLRGIDRERIQRFAAPLLDTMSPQLAARRPETRARALQIATSLGGQQYEATAIEFLDDPSPLVSLVAARALCQPGHAHCVVEVLERLDRLDTWSQALVSSMLAKVGEEAAPALRGYLSDCGRTGHTRAAVARSLELVKDLEAAEVAGDQLADGDAEVVASCLRLLYVVGSEMQAAAVRPLLTDERFFIRATAMATLGRLGSPQDAALIVGALDPESPWIAIRAARALAELHASAELAALVTEGGLPAEAALETLYGGVA